jgi:hypothetical protein
MGQLGLGAAAVTLFLITGKSYIKYIGTQLTEARQQHKEEIERLTAVWERMLADAVKRGDSWETAAHRFEQYGREATEQVKELSITTDTAVALLKAIHEQGRS